MKKIFILKKLSHKNAAKRVEGVKTRGHFGKNWGRFSADFRSLKLPILPIFFQAQADFRSKGVGNTGVTVHFPIDHILKAPSWVKRSAVVA